MKDFNEIIYIHLYDTKDILCYSSQFGFVSLFRLFQFMDKLLITHRYSMIEEDEWRYF